MTIAARIKARPWVESVDDERRMGHSIIVMLGGTFCFEDDPGCGTQGFDTWAEAERGTRVGMVYEAVDEVA